MPLPRPLLLRQPARVLGLGQDAADDVVPLAPRAAPREQLSRDAANLRRGRALGPGGVVRGQVALDLAVAHGSPGRAERGHRQRRALRLAARDDHLDVVERRLAEATDDDISRGSSRTA